MPDIVVTTVNRSYPLPNPDNNARADAARILAAIDAIDADMLAALRVATTGQVGRVRLATTADSQAGTLTDRAVAPAGLAASILDALSVIRGGVPTNRDTLNKLSSVIDVVHQAVLLCAPKASPDFTGTPTAPTAPQGTNTNQIATMAALQSAIANIVGSAPETLNALNELAAAIGNDPNYATTITNQLATKANLSGATFTGDITTHRGNNTGVVYLGSAKQAYLYFDGTKYTLNTYPLIMGGLTAEAGSFTDLTVGRGQIASTIAMIDTDDGNRQIHNNSGTIGFLNNAGAWGLRMYDTGALWTAQLGDLNTRIENRATALADYYASLRVARSGDTMSGPLSVQFASPYSRLIYPGILNSRQIVDGSGTWILGNGDNGAAYFYVTTSGALYSAQLGDINSRIENRANAFAADYAAARVAKTGDTMTGILTISSSHAGVTSVWPGIRQWRPHVGGDGFFYMYDDTGGTWRARFRGDVGMEVNGAYHTVGGAILTADGNLYMPWRGDYLSNALNAKFNTAGGTLSGGLQAEGFVSIFRSGVLHAQWFTHPTDGYMYLRNGDNGTIYMRVGQGGDIYTPQMGDVYSRIETRANDYAQSVLGQARTEMNRMNVRFVYAGDLANSWNLDGGYVDPYGGACMTTRATGQYVGGQPVPVGFRWRYIQFCDYGGTWRTVSYAS